MTIKDPLPAATHRRDDESTDTAEASTSSNELNATEYNFYSNHDSSAPPPYYQAPSAQAGASRLPDTDRNSLEELEPSGFSADEDDDEERRPLLPSPRRRQRASYVAITLLAALMVWILARKIQSANDSIYVPAPEPDPKLGKVIASANWSKPRRMERFDASNQMVWYAFEEFFVNATSNTSLFFYSKGTKVRAVTAISNVVDPPEGKVLVRAEVYASDKEMINTIALHQLRRGNWDGISLLQSEGNRWSDSKAFDIDLVVLFPKNMRRIGQGVTEDARPFLSNLRSEGSSAFVNAEDLLFGDVYINSTSDLRIRTMVSTGSITLTADGELTSGSLIKADSSISLKSHSIQLEQVESQDSISLGAVGDLGVAHVSSPIVSLTSHKSGIGIGLASVSKSLNIKAASGLQCEVELLSSSSPNASSTKPSQSFINVTAKSDRAFAKVNYIRQAQDVILFSNVQTGVGGLRVQHDRSFQGDFTATSTTEQVLVRLPKERRVLQFDEKPGEGERIWGKVWALEAEDRAWGRSIMKAEGNVYVEF